MTETFDARGWADALAKVAKDPRDISWSSWRRVRNQKLLRSVLDHCSLFGLTTGLAVLEIGTGSDEFEKLIREKLSDCEYRREDFESLKAAGLALPVLGGVSFDVVLLNALGHLAAPTDFKAIVRACAALLRPGGIVIVSDFMDRDAIDPAQGSSAEDGIAVAIERRFGSCELFAWDETPVPPGRSARKSRSIHVRAVMGTAANAPSYAFGPDDLVFEMDRPFGRALTTGAPFGIVRGKWNLIIGRSGSGKTSFLRAMQGDLTSYARKARGFPTSDYFYMPQVVDVFENLTPVQNVRAYGGSRAAALAYFDELGMTDFQTRKHAVEISGGERQRLLVAQIMAAGPELIILDEPSKGLDRAGRLVVIDALAERFGGNSGGRERTLVCADHDFAAIYPRFDYVFEIRNGLQILVWSK